MYRTSLTPGIQQLYAQILVVTNRHLCPRPLTEQIEWLCQRHPAGILLREKDLSAEEYLALAQEILAICEHYQVPCTLHTYTEAAQALHCPRIHLPLHLLRQARPSATDFSVIGTSVHSVSEAREAAGLGATYLTAGHIFATDCKKGLPPRGLSFLSDVCRSVPIPVYAIGGIHVDAGQITDVKACGAEKVCIMSDLMKDNIKEYPL